MQIRKLVKSGFASLVMAVPSGWIRKNKLKAGDLLYVHEDSDCLIVKKEPKKEHKKEEVKVISIEDKDPRQVNFEIASAYMNNYKHIIIKGKELYKIRKSVKKRITDLIALELVDESSEKIIAKDFLNLYDTDPRVVLRRMDNIIRSMFKDTKDIIEKKENADYVVERDDEVNRLNFLLLKLLKTSYLDKEVCNAVQMQDLDILRYWEINIYMEKIADRIKYIAQLMPEQAAKQCKSTSELLTKLEKIYEDAMKAVYTLSLPKSDQIGLQRPEMIKEIQKFMKKNKCQLCSQVAMNAFNLVANVSNISKAVRLLDND